MVPDHDAHNYGRRYLMDRLAVAMGGRAAEALVLNEVTSGAENDLKEASKLARRMVTEWGMASSLPPVAFELDGSAPFLGRQLAMGERHYSEEAASAIDREVERFISEAYSRATNIIERHQPQLEALVEALLRDEVVEGSVLDQLIGPRSIPALTPVT